MDGVEPTQVNDTIPQSTSASEMCRLASMVPDDQNIITCALAKQIAAINGLSQAEKNALQELSVALKIACDREVFDILEQDSDISERDFDVHLKEEQQGFFNIGKKFSMIAGAIGFLPSPFISDFTIISPLQLFMVDKIAYLYNYPLLNYK
jgi:hypothetical protein